jgi:hypothetical protein
VEIVTTAGNGTQIRKTKEVEHGAPKHLLRPEKDRNRRQVGKTETDKKVDRDKTTGTLMMVTKIVKDTPPTGSQFQKKTRINQRSLAVVATSRQEATTMMENQVRRPTNMGKVAIHPSKYPAGFYRQHPAWLRLP